jgi:hypothetical protein
MSDLQIDVPSAQSARASLIQTAGRLPTATPPDGTGCGAHQVETSVASLAGWAQTQVRAVGQQAGDLATALGGQTDTWRALDTTLAGTVKAR